MWRTTFIKHCEWVASETISIHDFALLKLETTTHVRKDFNNELRTEPTKIGHIFRK